MSRRYRGRGGNGAASFAVGDTVVLTEGVLDRGLSDDLVGQVRKVVHVGDLDFPAPYELEGDFNGAIMNFGPRDLRKASADDIQKAKASNLLYVVSTHEIDVPDYWKTRSGITFVPDLARWPAMQDLLTSTWFVKYTRDRRRAKVPSGARVTGVLRVENHESFSRYCKYTMALRDKRGACPRIDDGSEKTKFALDKYAKDLPMLQKDIHEMYLFHGTSPVAADSICRTDFDMARAGSAVGSMFGPGIYCAECASKSDEYAKEGDGIFTGQRALLLCRAVAGRINVVYEPGDYSEQVLGGEYDSILGDRERAVGTFREFIFFHSDAIYAEFIILYERTYEED